MAKGIRVRSALDKFTVVENSILERHLRTISGDGFSLWCLLRKFSDYETGECFPKISTLAEMMGVSRRTVERLLPILSEHGFLTVVSGRGDGTNNLYTVTVPGGIGCDKLSQGCDTAVAGGATKTTYPYKEQQEPKNENHKTETSPLAPESPSLFTSSDDRTKVQDLDSTLHIDKLFNYFRHVAGKGERYTLTKKRAQMAASRWKEALKITNGNVAEAKAMFRDVIDKIAASEFHQKNGFVEWDQLFRSEDNFTKWVDRAENSPDAA